MNLKNLILITGMFLLTSIICTAQVEPFTEYYNLDPDWDGDYFHQIIHTPDGGYAAVVNQNAGFITRSLLLKLNEYGEVEWQTILESPDYFNIYCFSLCMDYQGNYYMAGKAQHSYNDEYAYYSALIAKFDNSGELLWHEIYDTAPDSLGYRSTLTQIIYTKEDKLIAVGAQSHCGDGFHRSLIICVDTNGAFVWSWDDCYIPFPEEEYKNILQSVVQTNTNSLYAIGYTTVITTDIFYQGLIIKFDTNGEILFRKTFGHPECQAYFYDIDVVSENSLAVIGWTADTLENSMEDKHSLYIFDTVFNPTYQHNLVLSGSGSPKKVAVSEDSNIYVLASTSPTHFIPETSYYPDLLLIKYNSRGELLWKIYIGGEIESYFTNQYCIVADEDGGATFGCNFILEDGSGFFAMALYKVDSLGNGIYPVSDFPYPDSSEYIIYNSDTSTNSSNEVDIFPNPADSYFIVESPNIKSNTEILIFDISGKMIFNVYSNETQTKINTGHLPSGLYIVKAISDGDVSASKLIINH